MHADGHLDAGGTPEGGLLFLSLCLGWDALGLPRTLDLPAGTTYMMHASHVPVLDAHADLILIGKVCNTIQYNKIAGRMWYAHMTEC